MVVGSNADDGKGSRLTRRDVLISSSITATSALAGCTGIIGGGGDSVSIGAVIPLSGVFAQAGKQQEELLNMALQEHNQEVAGREIELHIRDSELDPGKATSAANELVQQEDIDILIGGTSSAVLLSFQEIAAREEIMLFGTGGSATNITGENCNRYTFVGFQGADQYVSTMQMGYEKDVYKSIYFLSADYVAGRDTYKVLKSQLEPMGVDVTGVTYFPLGNSDYSTQISKARDSGADMLYFHSAGFDVINFLSQAESAGLKDEMDLMMVYAGLEEAQGVTNSALSGVYGSTDFYWEHPDNKEFAEKVQSELDFLPFWLSVPAYDGFKEAVTAIDETGTTNANDMIPFLEGRDFHWSRKGTWRECDHRMTSDRHLLQAKQESEIEAPSYYEILGTINGGETQFPCDQTGCNMESN